MGHPEVTFRIRLITTVTNVVGFFVAIFLFKDIVFVAGAYVVRAYLLLPLILFWVQRYAGIRMKDQITELKGSVVATIAMSAAVLAIKLGLSGLHLHSAILLLIEVVVGLVVFFVVLIAVDRELLRDVLSLAAQSVPGGERIARRLGVALPAVEARPKGGKNRKAPPPPTDAEAAAEVATEGDSVAAELLGDSVGPSEETLGDV